MNRRAFLKQATWRLAAFFGGLALLRAVERFAAPSYPVLDSTCVIHSMGGCRVGETLVVYRGEGPVARAEVIDISSGTITVRWA